MAESTDPLIVKLKDMVECAICLEQFKDPRSLPCQHSFCRECLQGVLGTGRTIRCPCCNEEVPVPNGVSELAVDFRANSWLEILSEYERAKEAREAEVAGTEQEEGTNEDRGPRNPTLHHRGIVTNVQTPSPEAQLILNIQRNLDDTEALTEFLQHLIDLYGTSTCSDLKKTVETILKAIERHPQDDKVQVKGSCLLHRIFSAQAEVNLDNNTKRKLVLAMVDAIDNYRDDSAILTNACLLLVSLQILPDKVFSFERLVTSLVEVVGTDDQDEVVRYLGIVLISQLSTHVDSKRKQFVGDMDAIPIILKIIQHKPGDGLCDDTVEAAWSMLWNITDETPVNCGRFITEGGMDVVLKCLESSKEGTIIYNPLGVMCNISEVPHLRLCLQQKRHIQLLSELLRDTEKKSGVISYQACSILAYLVSDGEAVWLLKEPARNDILGQMVQAINQWNIMTELPFKYTTLKPIIRLLNKYDIPACQHFFVWAICNITTTNPETYCPILEKEGGLALIKEVLCDSRPFHEIRQLAQRVINNCDIYHAEDRMVSNAITDSIGSSGQNTDRVLQEPETGHGSEQGREACPFCEQVPSNTNKLTCGHCLCGNCTNFLLPVGGDTLHCPICSRETRILQDTPRLPNSQVTDQEEDSSEYEPLYQMLFDLLSEQPFQRSVSGQNSNAEAASQQRACRATTGILYQEANVPQISDDQLSAVPSFSQLLAKFEPSTRAHAGAQGLPMTQGSKHQNQPAPPDTPRPSVFNRQNPPSPPTSLRPSSLNGSNTAVPLARLSLSRAGPVFPPSTSISSTQPQAGNINNPDQPDRPQAGHGVSLTDILNRKMTLKKTPK